MMTGVNIMWSERNDISCEHDVYVMMTGVRLMFSVRNDDWCEHDIVTSVMSTGVDMLWSLA